MLVQAAWSRLQTLAVMWGVSSSEQRAPASSLSGHVADGLLRARRGQNYSGAHRELEIVNESDGNRSSGSQFECVVHQHSQLS